MSPAAGAASGSELAPVDRTAERLAEVRQRLAAAAIAAGRDPAEVRLVAISKKQPLAKLRAAHAAGQRDFGESYAQELQAKALALADLPGLRWHFVGKLQSNKARLVAPICERIHTLDGEALARALLQRAPGAGLAGLIEVNLGAEVQKGGVLPAEVERLAVALGGVTGLRLEGLMCLPPANEPPRPHFARLRALRDSVSRHLGIPLPELSMGMSNDFEIAIAEGATLIRVGTAIFGEREDAPAS